MVHDPLYSHEAHDSTITARAHSTSDEIESIQIKLIYAPIEDCAESGVSQTVYPCPGESFEDTVQCSFPSKPTKAECTYKRRIEPNEIVSYRGIVMTSSGLEAKSPSISFSPGIPADGTLKPIWWHTDLPPGYSANGRIRLGLFPDSDYKGTSGKWAWFAEDVDKIVAGSFFNDEKTFARVFTYNRDLFDIWIGPYGSDSSSACDSFPFLDGAAASRTGVDVAAIIHFNDFYDCADGVVPGNGSVSANSYYSSWTLVHEAGHFAFGLGDEYEGGGHFSCASPMNVFPDEDSCRDVEGEVAPGESHCKKINSSNSFRIDDGSSETMDDKTLSSSFQKSSGDAVANRLHECASSSNCFPAIVECTDY